jgi:8-oxo-dGTP diphosphatase
MEKQAIYGVLFNKEKTEVLLVQRRDLPVWVLPGGGLDAGETPLDGVKREVEEESGCKVEIIRQVAEYLPVNNLTHKTHFFECKIIGGSPRATEESKQTKFFPLDSLPSRLAPPFALWIKDALLGQDEVLVKKTEGVTYFILVTLLLKHPILITRYLLTKLGIRFNDQG